MICVVEVWRCMTGILAGIYYDPVAQLTLGLEAEYADDLDGAATNDDSYTV